MSTAVEKNPLKVVPAVMPVQVKLDQQAGSTAWGHVSEWQYRVHRPGFSHRYSM